MAVLDLLTADEVAAALRVSRNFVYEQKHKIGYVKVGRRIRFCRDALERFIESHTSNTTERINRISVRDL